MKSLGILVLLLIAVSCGNKQTTLGTLSVVSSFSIDTTVRQGGAVVLAHKSDGSEEYIRALQSGSLSLELSNGSWEFYALVWDGDAAVTSGSKNLTGVHRCGYASANLEGVPKPIPITVTTTNCNSSFSRVTGETVQVTQPGFIASNQFKLLSLRSCNVLSGSISTYLTCGSGGTTGVSQSVLVSIPDTNYIGGVRQAIGAGVASRCINMADYYSTYIRIPVVYNSSEDDGLFPVRIKSFASANCTGDSVVLPIVRSFNQTVDQAKLQSVADYSGNPVISFLHPPKFNSVSIVADYPAAAFGQCVVLTARVLDSSNNILTVANAETIAVNSSSTDNILFYNSSDCSGTASTYPSSVTIPAASNQAQFSARLFKSSSTVTVSAVGYVNNVTLTLNSAIPNFGTLSQAQFEMMKPLLGSSLMYASTLPAGARIIGMYNGEYFEMQLSSAASASILQLDFKLWNSSFVLSGTGTGYSLSSSSQSCLKMGSTPGTANYSGGLVGYQVCYNNLSYLNVFLYTAGSSGLYILTP